MKLEGSCHCGNVRFRCQAYAPVPFMHCYCSICRKTAGGKKRAELLVKIKAEGKTVLLIEHDVKLMMGLCDRISVLEYGKLIAEGLPHEIQSNQAVIDAYLGGAH